MPPPPITSPPFSVYTSVYTSLFLLVFYFLRQVIYSSSWPWTHCRAKDYLELLTHLPSLGIYRCAPPCWALHSKGTDIPPCVTGSYTGLLCFCLYSVLFLFCSCHVLLGTVSHTLVITRILDLFRDFRFHWYYNRALNKNHCFYILF